MELTKEQIEKAVSWWSEKIQNPKFDNGDDTKQGGMTAMLAIMAKSGVSKDQVEKFKESLTRKLKTDDMAKFGLKSDYGPMGILADAITNAGIDGMNVPWKTRMIFESEEVKVSYGYGAEYITL